MPTYKTPGVYTEEISLLPQSVAEVATAIPAFIGYTEFARSGDEDLLNKPARITSLLDYHLMFGGPPETNFKVKLLTDEEGTRQVGSIEITDELKPRFLMFYSLSIYFKNGGGPCYVVSVGDYSQMLEKKAFRAGLDALKKEDEPTLILLTDAVNLEQADYYELCQAALMQCSTLKDRFAVFDVLNDDNDGRGKIGAAFRNNIMGDLKYGAAYYPYIQTSLNHNYGDDSVQIEGFFDKVGEVQLNGLTVSYTGVTTPEPQVKIALGDVEKPEFAIDEAANLLTITIKNEGNTADEITQAWQGSGLSDKFNVKKSTVITQGTDAATPLPLEHGCLRVTYRGRTETPPQVMITMQGREVLFSIDTETLTLTITVPEDGRDVSDIIDAWRKWEGEKGGFNLQKFEANPTLTEATDAIPLKYFEATEGGSFYLGHSAIKLESTVLYNLIKTELTKQRVVLPPGPAVAGVYARVDRTRGVWNAPANEGIMAAIKPAVKITHDEQENLNIDTTAGKSINAIRGFVGKGTLIWGARTLAGNDNEWRYIPVRRLFNMIEESIQKSTAWAVFGPNNAMAWLKVKAMIESYLQGLWRAGALVGSKSEDAFFVRVGLGQTMTQQDILEGRMIIEVGIAAVRPAEFIILRFSHKMQEA